MLVLLSPVGQCFIQLRMVYITDMLCKKRGYIRCLKTVIFFDSLLLLVVWRGVFRWLNLLLRQMARAFWLVLGMVTFCSPIDSFLLVDEIKTGIGSSSSSERQRKNKVLGERIVIFFKSADVVCIFLQKKRFKDYLLRVYPPINLEIFILQQCKFREDRF
ncbi:hypothetical protein GcM1_246224 [Golovinomyces cichoracearum]|uniref:Uncharacterized protein n=1 Tax=Golovinomyces cichoracearum TaxID=62708 RepID=A0A420IEW0_9PEZI|nr:hypothetical protein GcM1_246224 [Golovinomyces cichoracearum]